MVLPPARSVRHDFDLVLGTKYCPLPKEQYDVIDAFSRTNHEAGLARESKSPLARPTFCVRIPNGKWRIVHAFNKLNAATIPAQTPFLERIFYRTKWYVVRCIALNLVAGYYALLVGASAISLKKARTRSGMYWMWLVMPQGLTNAPVTFNYLVTQLFQPHRTYAQTYVDDIFAHSTGGLMWRITSTI
ncbi:Reverse transcriptase [Phytophthora palmivora]|uniref:Reverse transcriptase n=1 Tax=Phytophthora palmivora TaxID=4796 RepID=A0A2P4WYD5_9STRA|nr:Reverse transcriptase [Phytophthora palmivora]